MVTHFPLIATVLPNAETEKENEQRLLSAFARLSRDDMSALEDTYELCANSVYGLALWRCGSHSDASDIVQELFLKLAKRRRFLASIKKPKSYILQVTHRLLIDFYRDKQRRMQREEQIQFLEPAFADPKNYEEVMQLHNAVAKLKPKEREILYLRYFAGLSFREIATATEVNLFTAAARCRLALARLRKFLGKKI